LQPFYKNVHLQGDERLNIIQMIGKIIQMIGKNKKFLKFNLIYHYHYMFLKYSGLDSKVELKVNKG
jgi:hypothetical protein